MSTALDARWWYAYRLTVNALDAATTLDDVAAAAAVLRALTGARGYADLAAADTWVGEVVDGVVARYDPEATP